MTSLSTNYTPLETLLLFQALRCENSHSPTVFDRISDQLKGIPLIQSQPRYDDGRLSPSALRELYQWLLKEEVKSDIERQQQREGTLQNGHSSPGSRKRKAPTAELPSVSAASKHVDLIPQLVTRLYARYRENTVREIREHERRHDALSREIEHLELSNGDEKQRNQHVGSRMQSPMVSPSGHTTGVAHNEYGINVARQTKDHAHSPLPLGDDNAVKPYAQSKIDALINHDGKIADGTNTHQRSPSTTALPPLKDMAPRSPILGIPPTIPPSTNNSFSNSPSGTHRSPYTSYHPNPLQGPLSRPSSSQRTLPPPKGMHFPPPSPVQFDHQSPALPGYYHSQHPEHPPPGYPAPYPPPGAEYYPQAPYHDRSNSYSPFPPQAYAPYPVDNDPAAFHQQQQVPNDFRDVANGRSAQHPSQAHRASHAHGRPSYTQPQHPATAPSTVSRVAQPADARVSGIIAALATPPRQQSARAPLWKNERRPTPLRTGTPIPSPDVEPLSPVLKRDDLATRGTRSGRTKAGASTERSEATESLQASGRLRGKARRDRSPFSTASSTADDFRTTRSHSVSTFTGALTTSDDRPRSGGNVKAEPSTPAAGIVDELETSNDQPSGGRMTRNRRGTLQALSQPSTKRKRQSSPTGPFENETEDPGTPPPRQRTVLATRNFHKLSSTIMNDINSHKHASYFANAVRDKDAPGYSKIIKRPQYLKSIRAAVSAGNKALHAATATLDSPSVLGTPTTSTSKPTAAGESSGVVELDRTEEHIPPKAIVNAAQLEKEVMRMFANAVMFNPGDDGMVSDTREMFREVEARMREWRDTEKEAGVVEVEEDEGRAKRRKL